eukprot:2204954-Rhodomonas_salina.3
MAQQELRRTGEDNVTWKASGALRRFSFERRSCPRRNQRHFRPKFNTRNRIPGTNRAEKVGCRI